MLDLCNGVGRRRPQLSSGGGEHPDLLGGKWIRGGGMPVQSFNYMPELLEHIDER